MNKHTYNLRRGDICFADLDPVIGSEQSGARPVLIIQNDVGNRFSPTVIVAPITGSKKPRQPTHIAIDPIDPTEGSSVVLLEQVRTIDRSRIRRFLGHADAASMAAVDRALEISLGLHGQSSLVR